MPPLLSDLRVGTFLIYPSKPIGEMAHRARRAVFGVKNDGPGFLPDEPMVEFVVRRLRETVTGSVLDGLFARTTLLVPAPGHAPRLQGVKQQLWPMRRLCDALAAAGLGRGVAPLLERIEAVPAAHLIRPGEARPSAARHFETLRVVADLVETPARVLLVDDVLTRGATLLACASRIHEFYPEASISGFALARTRSEPGEIPTPIAPALYRVVRWGEDCNVEFLGDSLA